MSLHFVFNDKYRNYEKGKEIGSGSYARVYEGYMKKEMNLAIGKRKKLALKKLYSIENKYSKEGVNHSAIHEILMLKELKHQNIIDLVDAYFYKNSIFLVYEHMESDLEVLIKNNKVVLTKSHIKLIMQQILYGVSYCHENFVLHRDLKPSNILLSPKKQLKIADFGLAKLYGDEKREMTPECVTRWYRPPELLFGATKYGTGVDMWSVGCIFAELLRRKPFFPGNSDIEQLSYIFAGLGTPTEKDWPNMKFLPNPIRFETRTPPKLETIFPGVSEDALDLLEKMLKFDPLKRISAADALKHPYFENDPKPCRLDELPFPS